MISKKERLSRSMAVNKVDYPKNIFSEYVKMILKLFVYSFFFAVVFIAGTALVLFAWFETNFRSFYFMVGEGSQFCLGMLMLMFPLILAYYFTEPIKRLIKLKICD